MIPPGSTIGILGGGQLGRMLALAAAPLGYKCHLFCPELNPPASDVCFKHTIAEYNDKDLLKQFSHDIDVCTYEFENVPTNTVELIEKYKPLRPGLKSLSVTQNRTKEKSFATQNNIPVAPWQPVPERSYLNKAIDKLGIPSILKSEESGYDGKGQFLITSRKNEELDIAWQRIGKVPAILEKKINFEREISVIIARSIDKNYKCFSPIWNEHKDGILDFSVSPAPISNKLKFEAEKIAITTAESLNHVGVLCVELFVTKNNQIILNEIAPRVHNSGHWTIEACETSQFSQHIRAIVNLPLRDPKQITNATMKNLIGYDIDHWHELEESRSPFIHFYGKEETRKGRKMGHVTWLYPPTQDIYIPSDF
ncbi:MAG: 5-(carboxyamino)imidazole ribonucleotide synthase [Rhodospirillaceae bacterium]|nr:5-(carboxyamino)imidazole ribonucleotide synthase [Rhodospirillaceae bacterium]